MAIHKVAEELRKAEPRRRRGSRGGEPVVQRIKPASGCALCRRNGRNRRGSAPPETPHPDDAETKVELDTNAEVRCFNNPPTLN